MPNDRPIDTGVKNLVLTSERLRYKTKSEFHSIPLGEISSIHYEFRHRPALVVLGVLAAASYAYLMTTMVSSEVAAMVGIAAVVLIVLYFLTRNSDLEFVSRGGGKIAIQIKGDSTDSIEALINKIETAREVSEVSLLELAAEG